MFHRLRGVETVCATELVPHQVESPWIDRDWVIGALAERSPTEVWTRLDCAECGGEKWLWPGDDVFEHLTVPAAELEGHDLVESVERFGAGSICNGIRLMSDRLARYLRATAPRVIPLVNPVEPT